MSIKDVARIKRFNIQINDIRVGNTNYINLLNWIQTLYIYMCIYYYNSVRGIMHFYETDGSSYASISI